MRVLSWLRPLAGRPNRTLARPAPRRPACRPRVEALENRCVPANHITEYPVPTPASGPDSITLGPDGNLWFTEFEDTVTATGPGKIGRITPDGQITEFDTPLPHPRVIVAGPDGNLWFTEGNSPTGQPAPQDSKVGVMSTAGVVLHEYPLPSGSDGYLAFGPDGSLWVSEYWNNEILRMGQDGQITARYTTPFPTGSFSAGADDIAVAPDGTVWFDSAARTASYPMLGQITPQGAVNVFTIEDGGHGPGLSHILRGLAIGPDGTIWAGEPDIGWVDRINPAGVVERSFVTGGQPYSLAVGGDGSVWFTDPANSQIGRLTQNWPIPEYPTPTPNSQPGVITAGPGGTVWVTEESANQIGKFNDLPPAPVVVARDPGTGAVNPTATIPEGGTLLLDASGTTDPEGDPVTYQWDFGDGSFDTTGAQVPHTFTENGVYHVTVKATDLFGVSALVGIDVTVTEVPPTASITNWNYLSTDAAGNWTSPEGSAITVVGWAADPSPVDLAVVNYSWSVTKNSAPFASGSGQVFTFTPDDNGTYVATVTVTDTDGTGSASQTIDVTNVPPAVQLTSQPGLLAGDLDSSFGTGGRVTTDLSGDDTPADAVLQSDGKTVVALSYLEPDGTYDTAVVRYLASGSLDQAFGQGGVVVVTGYGAPNWVGIQSGGRIVVAAGGNLFRLNPDGTRDAGFGPDGSGVLAIPAGQPVALQGDAILTAGTDGISEFTLTRYTADGLPDLTFGPDGSGSAVATIPPPPYGFADGAQVSALAVTGDAILVGGAVSRFSNRISYWGSGDMPSYAVIRFDAGGHLDTTFGGPDPFNQAIQLAGWAIEAPPDYIYGDGDSPHGIAVQPDGRIVLAGDRLVRFTAEGGPDGDTGWLPVYAQDVLSQPDGKLVLAGFVSDSDTSSGLYTGRFVVTRLNTDLTPDSTFGPGGDGQATLGFGSGVDAWLPSILLQPDGDILAVGASYAQTAPYELPADLQLASFRGQNAAIPEGSTIALVGSATDPSPVDAQALTYTWVVTKDGPAYQTASGPNYQFTPDDNGTYVVTLTVSDKDGGSTTDSQTFSVVNVAPSASIGAPAGPAVAGEVLTFTLGAADPSAVDQAAGFTYAIDWGDGTGVQAVTGPTGTQVTHVYAAARNYTASVTATDKDGGTSSVSTATVQVNEMMAGNLENVVSPDNPVTIQLTSTNAQDVVGAINNLAAQDTTVSGTVTLSLDANTTYGGLTVNVPNGMTLVIGTASYTGGQQATIDPDRPAFTVASGNVIVYNVTFLTTGDAPTILVTGGSLTLRNCVVQESADSDQAAIAVTGGTVDLGTSADPGGNTLNINGAGAFAKNTTSTPIAAVGDNLTVNGLPLTPSTLSGTVFEDFNDDGQIDFGEEGIPNVLVTLAGADDLGNAVSECLLTDSDGAYVFLNLRPGSYTITETQPADYPQGINSVGTAGGSLSAADQFSVPLGVEINGLNYNFGEQPAGTGQVQKGQTAGIGFWNNKNGQALILALPVVTNPDGSVTSVANWLAATLPNMFGRNAGSNDLTGKSNAYVAALFQSDFVVKGVKLDAQVLATALAVYATNATLDGTGVAAKYGFAVSGDGVGAATWNVGSNGDAFGVANNTTMTVMDLLLATDAQAIDGLLYNGNTTRRNEANALYSALNQAGSIS